MQEFHRICDFASLILLEGVIQDHDQLILSMFCKSLPSVVLFKIGGGLVVPYVPRLKLEVEISSELCPLLHLLSRSCGICDEYYF